ncbi:hypothetical protein OH76DRAFT_1244003 [Lentinus brumalis]|uniref:Uncharacterized protein n=1 Tax=Lentinus brumalis TaxID=2498619 RepID=A0A371CRZ3_9APHY|nr:hypothetical protein OH76DRAFT_1244003 [Polyporus brumalis]
MQLDDVKRYVHKHGPCGRPVITSGAKHAPAILGGIVWASLLVILVAILAFLLQRRRRRSRSGKVPFTMLCQPPAGLTSSEDRLIFAVPVGPRNPQLSCVSGYPARCQSRSHNIAFTIARLDCTAITRSTYTVNIRVICVRYRAPSRTDA